LIFIILDTHNDIPHQNESGEVEEEGFLTKIIKFPFRFISSIFCGTNTYNNDQTLILLPTLPNSVDDFQLFTQQNSNMLGILILYDETEIEFFRDFLNKILNIGLIVDILVIELR
jgi:hypothetical protein